MTRLRTLSGGWVDGRGLGQTIHFGTLGGHKKAVFKIVFLHSLFLS